MTNRGKKAIMIGYVRQNNNDTYRMYNLETGRVILTRDTRSTGISYGKLNNKPEERDDDRSDQDTDNDAEVSVDEDENNDSQNDDDEHHGV